MMMIPLLGRDLLIDWDFFFFFAHLNVLVFDKIAANLVQERQSVANSSSIT